MILKLEQTIKTTKNIGSIRDRRVKINRTTASYRGEDGHEYRKCFESKKEPVVPLRGTHETLNRVKYQYEIKKTRKNEKKSRNNKKNHQ